jgi:hypothetical protein
MGHLPRHLGPERAAVRTQSVTMGRGFPYILRRHAAAGIGGWIVLDLIGIAFSGVMILFVIYRAMLLDNSQPWFEAPPEPAPAPEAAPTPPGRRPPRSRGSSR